MSSTALQKYSNAVAAVKEHKEANAGVFDAHEKLVFAVIDAENELRDAVAVSKEGVSNGMHRVTITPQTQTIVDPDDLKAHQGEALTPELIAELTKTYERPPRITIGEVASA